MLLTLNKMYSTAVESSFIGACVHGSFLHLLEVVFRLLSAVDPLMLAKSLILSLNEALNLGPRP